MCTLNKLPLKPYIFILCSKRRWGTPGPNKEHPLDIHYGYQQIHQLSAMFLLIE